MGMCAVVTCLSCYVYTYNGVAINTMWYGGHVYYGADLAQPNKQMIILYVIAVLMAIVLLA